MALNPALLASQIQAAIAAPSVTPEILGFATAVCEEIIENGLATFAYFSGPHIISELDGASLANRVAGYLGRGPESANTIKFCTGITEYIMDAGVVFYASKAINPPLVPPELSWQNQGTITLLIGPDMADSIESFVGAPFMSSKLIAKCTAICNHIMSNAQVEIGIIF
jgi:hypothetical protein